MESKACRTESRVALDPDVVVELACASSCSSASIIADLRFFLEDAEDDASEEDDEAEGEHDVAAEEEEAEAGKEDGAPTVKAFRRGD